MLVRSTVATFSTFEYGVKSKVKKNERLMKLLLRDTGFINEVEYSRLLLNHITKIIKVRKC